MKRLQGLMAAMLITFLAAFGMVAIGLNATANADSVPVSDSPAQAAAAQVVNVSNAGADQAQNQQLQDTLKQYQAREKQYQAREKQYQTELAKVSQQLNDATAQADQLKQILMALQQRGVINISEDGRISIPRG
jgi:hypothetical protein